MATRSSQPSLSRARVCVCRKPDCLHIPDIAVFCIAINSFATNHYSLRNKLFHSSRHCIHSRCCLLFLARSCVLRLSWSLLCVTWRTFHSNIRPQIIQPFRFHKENVISGFAICHPGQRRVPVLVSNIHNNIKLNPTYEEHSSIDFLDLTILRKRTKLKVDIYRKLTTTDTTINFLSNYPIEQKMAAFRFHITIMHSLLLDPDKKQKEWKTIQTIAKNNNLPQQLLPKLNRQIHHKASHTQTEKKDDKIWTTFTYHSPKIRKITNLLKNTNIGIAFKITTTLHQFIRPTTQIHIPDH